MTFTTQPSVPWPLGNTTPAPSLCPSQPTARMGSALVASTHPHSTGSGGGCHSHRPRRLRAWITLCPPAGPGAPAPGGCAATVRHPCPRPTPGEGQQPPCPCTLPSTNPGFCPSRCCQLGSILGIGIPCPLEPTGQQRQGRGDTGVQPLSGWASRGLHRLVRVMGLGRRGGHRMLQARHSPAEGRQRPAPPVLTEGAGRGCTRLGGVQSSPGWRGGTRWSGKQKVGARTGQTSVSCEPTTCTAPREAVWSCTPFPGRQEEVTPRQAAHLERLPRAHQLHRQPPLPRTETTTRKLSLIPGARNTSHRKKGPGPSKASLEESVVPRGVPAQSRTLNGSANADSRAERSAKRRGPRGGVTRPWAGPWARGRGPGPASGRGRRGSRGRRAHLAVVQCERQQVGRGCAAAHGRPLDALHGGARGSAGPGRTRAGSAQDSSGRACHRALGMPGARGAGRRGAAPSREGGPSAQVAPAPVPVHVGGS